MRLISQSNQIVHVAGTEIPFDDGEYIVSEHSHKYAPEDFARLASTAGWTPVRCWLDDDARFSVHVCRAA